jgi:hypothetical protein
MDTGMDTQNFGWNSPGGDGLIKKPPDVRLVSVE